MVAAAINEIAAPAVVGMDPLGHEQIWDKLYWLLAPRGQTGYASHAIAAIDLALWDLKGEILGQPVWRLLGGARSQVPVYATFGFAFFDRDELVAAAANWAGRGFKRLKMTVGHHGLQRRDEPRPLADVIAEDVKRIARCATPSAPRCRSSSTPTAAWTTSMPPALAQRIEDVGIAFFEEPVSQNDIPDLVELRGKTRIPLAAGQNEGLASRFRDMLWRGPWTSVQPNVASPAATRSACASPGWPRPSTSPIANGGAWPYHNMHLHAGLANGGFVEYHRAPCCSTNRSIVSCRRPRTAGSSCPMRPDSVSSPIGT